MGDAHGVKASLLKGVATAAEALLMIGLFPFTLKGASIIPFESDGLKLLRIPFAKAEDLDREFARYYAASTHEALVDGDTARALEACRTGLEKFGPPWSDAFRNLEVVVLSRAGDHRAALAQAERDLARELAPMARSFALNNWSWFAFLQRDDANLRLADRRSADAVTLQPELAAVAGTRGAILLWQGRVAESLSLLERGRRGARDRRARAINACLLAMAYAARGEGARAQHYLDEAGGPELTEGLWTETESMVRSANDTRRIRASRGTRTLVLSQGTIELHQGARLQHRLAPSDIDKVRVGLSARGRAHLLLVHHGTSWRLPLDPNDLSGARMLLGAALTTPIVNPHGPLPSAEGNTATEAQERAYQERVVGQQMAVSSPKGVLLLGSAVAFATSMLFFTTWKSLALIMPVLFLHELGHWLAMRAFGHDDARISFIPFLGAATMTKTPFEKRWQEVAMLLAGPVPGIVLGMALMVAPLSRTGLARSAAMMLLTINVLNLLPLHPLDGGRILHALVTAGRPRLDLAFKTVATLAFLGTGILSKDPVLVGLGVLGVLYWRNAYRVAELERRIRNTPGFDPGLPPKDRRAYIFRALGEASAHKGGDWATTVAGLEMPLASRRPPLWQLMVLGGGFVVFVLGTGALARRSLRNVTKTNGCPSREQASPVSCGAAPEFGDINWNTVPASAKAQSPTPRKTDVAQADESYDPFKVGAFIWCSFSDAASAADLTQRLREAAAGGEYCMALPWEGPLTGSEEIRRKARWTLSRLGGAAPYGGPNGLQDFDELAAEARRSPEFDPDTARLLREMNSGKGAEPIRAAAKSLEQRLGPSPNRSCERLVIENVRESVAAKDGPGHVVQFAARMAAASDFAAVAGYLCKVGCRLQVLPANAEDHRLRFCF
jgi:Zn-dependent protease